MSVFSKYIPETRLSALDLAKMSEYDKQVADYNTALQDWQGKAEAYNAAIQSWNATDRTTPYESWSGYVVSPGEFSVAQPVFSEGDPTQFAEDAQARAVRRAEALTTAQDVFASPNQTYTYQIPNAGSVPNVNLAGLSGFSSSALSFKDGGVAGLFRRYAEGGEVEAEAPEVDAIPQEKLEAMRQRVIKEYQFDPETIAIEEGVDPDLFLRMMYMESRGRHSRKNKSGATGLMQLMPATAKELGVDETVAVQNARGGARYLKKNIDRFGSVPLALAAYNAGPGNVRKYNGVPPFEETQNYVLKIYGSLTPKPEPEVAEEAPAPAPEAAMAPEETPEDAQSAALSGILPALPTTGEIPANYFPDTKGYTTPLSLPFSDAFQKAAEKKAAERPTAPPPRLPVSPVLLRGQPKGLPDGMGIDFYRQYSAQPQMMDAKGIDFYRQYSPLKTPEG